jgi:hypothetical protein
MFSALLSSGKFVVEICRWYSDDRGVSVADLRVDKIPPGWQSNRRPNPWRPLTGMTTS